FFACLQRYSPLIMEVTRPRLEVRGEHAWFGCEYSDGELRHLGFTLEKELAAWLAGARSATLRDWAPEAGHLQTPGTDSPQYRRFFRAPVENEAGGCWLVFDAALLELPVLGADRNLFALLSSKADALLVGSRGQRKFADQVREAMLPLMRHGR